MSLLFAIGNILYVSVFRRFTLADYFCFMKLNLAIRYRITGMDHYIELIAERACRLGTSEIEQTIVAYLASATCYHGNARFTPRPNLSYVCSYCCYFCRTSSLGARSPSRVLRLTTLGRLWRMVMHIIVLIQIVLTGLLALGLFNYLLRVLIWL